MLGFSVVWGSMTIRGGESGNGNDAGENDCLDGLHFFSLRDEID